jgi:hypothetical protein
MELGQSSELSSSRLVKSSLHFMELERSQPFSQEPPFLPVVSQMNPVHVLLSCFLKIYLNIIRPLSLGLPRSVCPSSVPIETLYESLPFPLSQATCHAPVILLDKRRDAVVNECLVNDCIC